LFVGFPHAAEIAFAAAECGPHRRLFARYFTNLIIYSGHFPVGSLYDRLLSAKAVRYVCYETEKSNNACE
jgi:hypothetical protein